MENRGGHGPSRYPISDVYDSVVIDAERGILVIDGRIVTVVRPPVFEGRLARTADIVPAFLGAPRERCGIQSVKQVGIQVCDLGPAVDDKRSTIGVDQEAKSGGGDEGRIV